jgi:hypothetical protein
VALAQEQGEAVAGPETVAEPEPRAVVWRGEKDGWIVTLDETGTQMAVSNVDPTFDLLAPPKVPTELIEEAQAYASVHLDPALAPHRVALLDGLAGDSDPARDSFGDAPEGAEAIDSEVFDESQ